MHVVQQAQGEVDQSPAFLDDLGLAPEAGQVVPHVAFVLLEWECQVLAGEQLVGRNHVSGALPIIGDEGCASQPDLVEQPSAGCTITPTQNQRAAIPRRDVSQANRGHNVLCIKVIGAPDPELGRLSLR